MSAWHHLRLITVDLDDTVWPCAPVIQAAETAHYAWLAAQAPRLAQRHDLESLRANRRVLMQTRPDIAHDVTALRHVSLLSLLSELGYSEQHANALADGAMRAFRVARNQVEPYPDVAAVLARLRRHCPLVAVTNGNAQIQHTPLRDTFNHCLTAADAGAAKPDPALFELAMRWADARPEQTLHIGDDPALDVEAARAVGLAAIWVNRTGRAWPTELQPPLLEVAELTAAEAWLGLGETE
ncbi:HAD family hydrolase [Halochromatium roseum]|uniref:HAD family hydrolase n=1 Tax=Halochromatium roseum TaxID=391920 RepID=UPI0019146220|nr:HAD-IA family hydrolase [Halochromatium roseum]MBK5937972.1 haloacid dehalogenase [Halochromatium roseum]